MSNELNINIKLDDLVNSHVGAYQDSDGDWVSGPVTFADVVFDKVVGEVKAEVLSSDDGGKKLRAVIDQVKHEVAREVIRERLATLVDEAIAASIQPTNRYGEPDGGPRTLRQIIIDEAKTTLTAKAKDRNGYNSSDTLINQVIKEEVNRTFNSELQKEVNAAKAEVRGAVQKEAARVLAETITDIARKGI